MLRFHTQTGGATLTAQQPENNIVRTAYEALAAVLGGTQSLHTNSFDEALSLPTEHAVRIALRTQQVLASETGVVDTADPLAGSYFVESMTNDIETRAWELIEKIDGMGGSVAAIEAGFLQDEIAESAYRVQQRIEDGSRVIVGVNAHVDDSEASPEIQRIDETEVAAQLERVKAVRAARDQEAVDHALADITEIARGSGNLLYPMREALAVRATLGEVSDALRGVFGVYTPSR
jgi:methylmalonyl-CoA mutase N-terminal domain/subunit